MGHSEEPTMVGVVASDSEDLDQLAPPKLEHDEMSLLPWLCVVGSSFYLMTSFGFMQSIGTIQSYLQLNQLSSYTARDVGWIIGLYQFLGLLLGIQAGPLMDYYGPRILAPVATAITVAMFFFMAECKKYWQFMLCLGILGGIGAAMASTIAISTIGKLFVRRRGLAMGVAFVGSSIGGVMFPLVLRHILPALGWQWALRIIGFLVLGVMTIGLLCLLPFPLLVTPLSTSQDKKTPALNFVALRSPAFVFITIGFFLLDFAITGISGLLPTFATAAGFPANTGYTLVAVLNASSCFGRVIPGMVGDRIGHFDVLLTMIITTSVFTGSMFIPFASKDIRVLFVFAAFWGFGSGSFVSITPICVGRTCNPRDVGRYYGTMTFVTSFGALIAVSIGGEMLESIGSTAASALFFAAVVLGGVCFYVARSFIVKRKLVLRARI
ncbi:major facilitator superfamily transporter, partial [Dactylonectria estremocensis]